MVHQDRAKSRTQERERERDQTHNYCYIPSAPRVNYSFLVMEITGMMKMATGEGSPPLRQGAGTGSRLVFGGYRGLWGGTPYCAPGCFRGIWIYIGGRSRSVELRGAHEVGGGPRGQARLPASWPPRFFLEVYSKSPGSRLFQK